MWLFEGSENAVDAGVCGINEATKVPRRLEPICMMTVHPSELAAPKKELLLSRFASRPSILRVPMKFAVVLLMIEILHDLRYQNLWNTGSMVYRGSCRIAILNSITPWEGYELPTWGFFWSFAQGRCKPEPGGWGVVQLQSTR